MQENIYPKNIIREMILRALAHDFYTPFRVLASATEALLTSQFFLKDDQKEELKTMQTFIQEKIWPTLSQLNNTIEKVEIENLNDFVFFVRENIGTDVRRAINMAAALVDALEKPAAFSRNRDFYRNVKNLKLARKKIANMLSLTRFNPKLFDPLHTNEQLNLGKSAKDSFELFHSLNTLSHGSKIYGSATISGNNAQLALCLHNLISNAVKYRKLNDNNALVDVLIRKREQDELLIFGNRIYKQAKDIGALGEQGEIYSDFINHIKNFQSWIEIKVRDLGVGIPPKKIWGVFQLYKQLKPEEYTNHENFESVLERIDDDNLSNIADAKKSFRSSSNFGYGLALTQCFIRAHGGEIILDSKEGGPTTFALWLPQRIRQKNIVNEDWPHTELLWWER